MSFVLVSTDCSCCKPEMRLQVYKRLTDEGWKRMTEDTGDSTSVWLGLLAQHVSYEEAMAIAKNKFYSVFNLSCKPTIVFHWSINERAQSDVPETDH